MVPWSLEGHTSTQAYLIRITYPRFGHNPVPDAGVNVGTLTSRPFIPNWDGRPTDSSGKRSWSGPRQTPEYEPSGGLGAPRQQVGVSWQGGLG